MSSFIRIADQKIPRKSLVSALEEAAGERCISLLYANGDTGYGTAILSETGDCSFVFCSCSGGCLKFGLGGDWYTAKKIEVVSLPGQMIVQ